MGETFRGQRLVPSAVSLDIFDSSYTFLGSFDSYGLYISAEPGGRSIDRDVISPNPNANKSYLILGIIVILSHDARYAI